MYENLYCTNRAIEVAPVGAWIEIIVKYLNEKYIDEVAPVGAWIEISVFSIDRHIVAKSPLLGRGLKYPFSCCKSCINRSRPCWGVD